MSKSIQELAGQLKDEPLPTAGQELDDLPMFGGFTPPPPPGAYRFELPKDLNAVWDLFDVPDKQPPQRVRLTFDRDHPLLIVQSPKGASNGEPFETRLTNNERGRGKGKEVIASDLDYLLRALGDKSKPSNNRGYMQAIQSHAGQQFGADLRYSLALQQGPRHPRPRRAGPGAGGRGQEGLRRGVLPGGRPQGRGRRGALRDHLRPVRRAAAGVRATSTTCEPEETSMSKKRDPLVAVIHYFNTIDLTAAEQARVMVNAIVRSRQPVRAPKKPAATPKRRVETEPPLPLN